MNIIAITGRLGRDPVSKQLGDGKTVCSFSVAVTGRKGDPTLWLEIRCWDKLGANCQKFLAKGRQVNVVGEMRAEEWTGRDGEKRKEIRVTARTVDFLGGGEQSTGSSAPASSPQPGFGSQIADEDIPF